MPSKRDIEAGGAFVRLFLKDDLGKALAKSLASAGKSLQDFGASTMKAGAAVGAAGTAILAPLAAAVKSYVDMGGAAIDASARTGLSVEALSELGFAAEQTGATVDDLEIAMKKIAKGGFAKAGESAEQTFTRLAGEIASIEDPMLRAAKAQEYFGRSGTKLLPMVGDLEALRAKARELGIVMSGEDAAAADDLGDVIDQVRSQFRAMAFQVGKALAGPVKDFATRVSAFVPKVIDWVKSNQSLVVTVGKIGMALVAAGVGLVGLGVAAKVAAVALSTAAMAVSAVGAVLSGIGNTIALPFRLLGAAATAASKTVGIAMRQAASLAAGVFSGLATGARVAFIPIVSAAASAGAAIGQRIGAGVGAAAAKTAMFAAQSVPAVIKSLQGIGPAARNAWSMIKTTADPAYLKATWQDIRSAAGRAFRAMRSDAFSFYKLLRTSLDPAYLKATWAGIRSGAGVAFRSARASVFGFYNALRTARGAAAGLVGTLARVGGGMGRGLGRLSGAAGGLVGAAGMLGAMGIGGAFAPMLAMAPLVLGVLGSIGSALAAVASPVGLLAAGVVAGAVAWVKFSESGRAAWQGLVTAVLPIVETLKGTFGAIKDAIAAGEWGAAGKLAIAGLKLAVFQGLGEIEKAFPNVFATILRTVGKIGDGLITAWGKVTGFLTDQWNNWGKSTLNTVMEVAGMIPDIWQNAVENMANWMLEQSAKGGISGAVFSKILGVDMADEQAKAKAMEEARQVVQKRNLEWSIAQGKKEGLDTTQLEAELQALGGPQKGVDVLADARQAVKAYTDNLRSSASGEGGVKAEGRVSEAIAGFAAKLESGLSVEEAQAEFDRLKESLAKTNQAAAGGATAGTAAVAGPAASGTAAVAAALGAPRGVSIGPTYSAAAAQAAGQMGRGGPQEKMVTSINQMAKDLRELGVIAKNQDVSNKQVVTMYERFLAAFQYG